MWFSSPTDNLQLKIPLFLEASKEDSSQLKLRVWLLSNTTVTVIEFVYMYLAVPVLEQRSTGDA